MRELQEECCVAGTLVRETSIITYGVGDQHYTYLVEIGDREPRLGHDPEFDADDAVLAGIAWLELWEIPERDRAFLWASGLTSVNEFYVELEQWSNDPSYPQKHSSL